MEQQCRQNIHFYILYELEKPDVYIKISINDIFVDVIHIIRVGETRQNIEISRKCIVDVIYIIRVGKARQNIEINVKCIVDV